MSDISDMSDRDSGAVLLNQRGARVVSVKEAASILGITPRTVRRWAENGQLLAERMGSRWRIRLEGSALARTTAEDRQEAADVLDELPEDLSLPVDQLRMMVRRFRSKVEQFEPDLIVVRDRQGHRAMSRLQLVPSRFAARMIYSGRLAQLSPEEIDGLTADKHVLVVDESSARGRGHRKYTDLLPRARVQHLVLAVLSATRDAGELRDLGTDFAAELDPRQFRAFTGDLLRLTADTPPLDPDHLNVTVSVSIEDWQRLKSALYTCGSPFDLTPYLGSEDLEVWTLDDPNFFYLPSKLLRTLVFDGSCKIRLYYRHSTQRLILVPMAYPRLDLQLSDLPDLTGILGWPRSTGSLRPPAFALLTPTDQVTAEYRVFTTVLACQLLVEFLPLMKGVVDQRVLSSSITLSRRELFEEIHPASASVLYAVVDTALREGLNNFILPGMEPWREWDPVSYKRPIQVDAHASVFDMARIAQAVISWLRVSIDALHSSGVAFERLFVPGSAVLTGVQEAARGILYSDFSRWLDYALDTASAKPGEVVSALSNGTFRVERGYALGEASGLSFDPDRPTGEKFVLSRRGAPGDDQVDRCHAALHIALHRLQEHSGLQFHDEFLINKVLANLMCDWPKSRKPLGFIVRPYRYGPVVDIPQRHSRLNSHLGVRASVQAHPWFEVPRTDRVVGARPLDPRERALRDEHIDLEDEQSILSLVDLYCSFVLQLDNGDFRHPNSLLQLSINRNERSVQAYLGVEFQVWIDDLRDLNQALISIRPGSSPTSRDRDVVRTRFRNLGVALTEIERKIGLYNSIGALLDRLENLPTETSTDRALRDLTRRLRDAQVGMSTHNPGISKIQRERETLENLTALAGEVCRVYFGTGVRDGVVRSSTGALAKRHPFVSAGCDLLSGLLTANNGEGALRALSEIAEELYDRVFGALAKVPWIPLKEKLQTLYSEVDQALREMSKSEGRPCLVAYLDILGVQRAIDRMVHDDHVVGDAHEALRKLCDPITEVLNRYYEKHKDQFVLAPIRSGGDGWLIAFRDAQGPEHAVDKAIDVMKAIRDAAPPMLPAMGLHPGKPQFGIGGPDGLAAIIAYVCAEKSRLGAAGDILLSQEMSESIAATRPVLTGRMKCLTENHPLDLPLIGKQHIFRLEYWNLDK